MCIRDSLGENGFLPVRISGKKLEFGCHQFDRASAQVKSAMLLASTSGAKQSITLPVGSRDHTENILPHLGYDVDTHLSNLETVSAVLTKPVSVLHEYTVPTDPSAMIFWLIVLPILPSKKMKFKSVLRNPTRTRYLNILEQLGYSFEWKNTHDSHGESRGDISATYHNQGAVDEGPIQVDGKWCIDEIPALSAIATVAGKTLLFQNVEELKLKESNRLDKTIELVRIFGAEAVYENQSLRVVGRLLMNSEAVFASLGDHRLVMSYIMLCFASNSKNKVDSLGAHKVSYPQFMFELKKLGVTID